MTHDHGCYDCRADHQNVDDEHNGVDDNDAHME